jgi:3-ketosteroid 9alpha-monooxygenase subunit A
MKPTAWFQVAWSDEIAIGDVHKMAYLGQERVATSPR